MVTDLDIWRAANLVIEHHGSDAEFVACGRVDDMIEAGDAAGEATWKRILAAVRELQRTSPVIGEPLH